MFINMFKYVEFTYSSSLTDGYRVAYAPSFDTARNIIERWNSESEGAKYEYVRDEVVDYDDIPDHGLVYSRNTTTCRTKKEIVEQL